MNENSSRKRLGRGLAALIGDIELPDVSYPPHSAPGGTETVPAAAENTVPPLPEADPFQPSSAEKYLPTSQIIRNPQNPRRHFAPEDIAELAQSIAEHGVVQPLLVRPSPAQDGCYELIAGERRWRAAQEAGLAEVPVLLRDVDDRTALELAIIENVQRADLNPVEEAEGYNRLIEEYGYLQADLAKIIGKSRSHVTNMLRLLKLPPEVLELLSSGRLTMGHARCLINTENPSELARQIVAEGLSVRQAEQLAARSVGAKAEAGGAAKAQATKEKDPAMLTLEKTLTSRLGSQVAIALKNRGGEIRIQCKTADQLEAVCRLLERAAPEAAETGGAA